MIEEIALDKARIVRNAAADWAAESTNWLRVIDRRDLPWFDPDDLATSWLGKRLDSALGMTEVELTRAAKRYLNSWAQALLRKPVVVVEETRPEATEWDGMVEDLNEAENVARRKSGKKNLTPWVAPRGQAVIGGETVDYTSHEFWSDMYLYAIENPERPAEAHTAFIRRMGDAGANAKYLSEKMPQAHNGVAKTLSLSASPDASVAASLDGKFDLQYQTLNRPIVHDRRPMNLRDEPWETHPVTTVKAWDIHLARHREWAKKRYATEPMRG